MKHLKIIFALFFLTLIISCSNDDGDATEEVPTGGSNNNNSNKAFVVGGEAKGSFIVPVIWTNGVKTYLPSVADTSIDDLKIVVQNNDVYVAGVEITPANKMSLVLWKNGVQSRISESANYAEILQLIVDNGNVYVLGRERLAGGVEKYRYWKNGVATTIINNSVPVTNDIEENSISEMVVANNDVYCVGYEWNTTGTTLTAKYWKNAVPTTITVFKDDIFDYLKDIQVVGNDVSILYNQLNPSTFAQEVKLWKNGTTTVIASGNSDFYASELIIKEGVEHILVRERISSTKVKVLYYKNRVKTEITDGSFDVTWSFMNVDGSNVCVAYFTDLTFTYSNKYWLNGTTKTLNGNASHPFDAFYLAGTNVYMTSSEGTVPKFWVNGAETALPFEASKNYTIAYDVFATQ